MKGEYKRRSEVEHGQLVGKIYLFWFEMHDDMEIRSVEYLRPLLSCFDDYGIDQAPKQFATSSRMLLVVDVSVGQCRVNCMESCGAVETYDVLE